MKTIEAAQRFTALCEEGKLIEAADFIVSIPDESLTAMARGIKVRALELLVDPSEGFQDRAMNNMEWIMANKVKLDSALVKRKQLYLEANGEPATDAPQEEPEAEPKEPEEPAKEKPKRRVRKIKLSDVSGGGTRRAEEVTSEEANKAIDETEAERKELVEAPTPEKKEPGKFAMVSSDDTPDSPGLDEINSKLDIVLSALKTLGDNQKHIASGLKDIGEAHTKSILFLQNLGERIKGLSLRSEETQHSLLIIATQVFDVGIDQALTIFRNGHQAIQEIKKSEEE